MDGLNVAALIESAAGLLACEAIARRSGLARLQIGEADLAASLGLDVSPDESELLPARHRVVVCAAAAGLEPPVGPVSTELRDSIACVKRPTASAGLASSDEPSSTPARSPL